MTAAQPQFALGSGARTPLGWRDPVRRFVGLAVAGVVTMVVAAVALGLPMVAVAGPAGVLTVALVGCAIGLRRTHPHPRLGTANAITLLRLAIVGLLLSILFGGGVSTSIGGSSVAERNLDRITVAVGLIWAATIIALGLITKS